MNTWKKQIRKLGFPEVDCIKRISEGVMTDKNEGGLYKVITVYLEKQSPLGPLRGKEIIDAALVRIADNPVAMLLKEISWWFVAAEHEANQVDA